MSLPCNQLVCPSLTPLPPSSGNRPDSRWEFSKLPGKVYIKSSISVEFKTTAREGVIFYAAAENQIDFIALYLKNGNVRDGTERDGTAS